MTDVVNDVIINYESVNLDQTVGGIKQTSVALDGLVVSASSTEKATASLANKFSSLERSLGTSAASQREYEAKQKTINLALAQNPELAGRAAEASDALKAKYLQAGTATDKLSEAHVGLTTQQQAAFHAARGFIEQIAVGIPFTQAFTSELNHLTYASTGPGGLSGAFSGLGGFIKNLVPPTTLWIGGIVAATAAAAALANQWDKVQVSSQRALIGAGARTGTTVSDLNSFVSQNSGVSGSGLSNKEARALGENLTKTGDIVVSQLHGMSDAVVGFSNQTGKSITEATKDFVAFGKDPIAGMKELAGVFGDFDIATRKAVEEFVRADDKTSAYNVVLDALSQKSKEAAQNMGGLERAARTVTNALATESGKPVGLEQQLEPQRQRVVNALNTPTGGRSQDEAAKAAAVDREAKAYDDLNAALQRVDATRAKAQTDKLSTDADNADRAIISQINAIDQLKTKIEELNRAKAAGTTSQFGAQVDSAALQAAKNQLQALKESEAEAARYNQQVAAIGTSWGNVGQSIALQLQALQNSLPVAQAWTEATRMRAQQQATYNNLIDQGRTSEEAAALSAKQYELSKAAAVANAEKLVQSSQDNLDKIKAQGTEMQNVVSYSIAYRDAIQAGATATQAAAIASNTLAASMEQAAQSALQMQNSATQTSIDAANYTQNGIVTAESGARLLADARNPANSPFFVDGKQFTSTLDPYNFAGTGGDLFRTDINKVIGSTSLSSGVAGIISAIKNAPNDTGATDYAKLFNKYGYNVQTIFGPDRSLVGDKISALDSAVQYQNSTTTDKGVQAANIQAEVGYLKTLPFTAEVGTKIADLTKSIQDLTGSTNSLNTTNSELLSPYYTQDPRTSHIGFRSQGMASTGYIDIPGVPSANDNMTLTLPVASGERVNVGNGPNRGAPSIVINMPVTIQGNASRDEVGRTMFQVGQSMAKQLQAASR